MQRCSVHFAGRLIDLDDPGALDVGAIAATLSRICRFAGNLRDDHQISWHSVADHCVLTAELLRRRVMPAQTCLAGLLHDAHEALIGDVITPTKTWLTGGGYGTTHAKRKEHDLERKVLRSLGCEPGTQAGVFVKQADVEALHIEVCALGLPHTSFGLRSVVPFDQAMLRELGVLQPTAHLPMAAVFLASQQRFLKTYAALRMTGECVPEAAHA